ncbi:maleylpyruvate isomerase N-terminal domain-containing protein [Streptomyces sp. SCA3-4]|uniref:maleylpyruvate isomerase N-terminal domain-containing protein n=1 Tax=Streptomyces sichuanensis TaxID=2871810 RepID=UPI001CE2C3ED|nr:maleylpyruvate isomerase N-terminal domain-containing protein [Streptomyces sichuanensis]MCA6095211.1 maleylpyruvate isomerase N-terminal domain-containing protein [Streptomyces sichuanensis]
MVQLSYERYCTEIVAQTDLLRASVGGADPAAPVPTCPGWNLGRLLRHLGGAHRWAAEVVETRARGPVPDDLVNDVPERTDEDPGELDAYLAEGAGRLAEALRAAGPAARVWTPVPGQSEASPLFWARRMTHETAVHRADATWAAGGEFAVAGELAVDALDEWMEFGTLPEVFEAAPGLRRLLGDGRRLHFRATDTAGETDAQWLAGLSGERLAWSRGGGTAATVVRGPLTGLLLTVYGRGRHGSGRDVEVRGDTELFAVWQAGTGFWLHE